VSHPLVNLLGGQLKLDYLPFTWVFSTKKYLAKLGLMRSTLLKNTLFGNFCHGRTCPWPVIVFWRAVNSANTAHMLEVNNTSPRCSMPIPHQYYIIYWCININSVIVIVVVIVIVIIVVAARYRHCRRRHRRRYC